MTPLTINMGESVGNWTEVPPRSAINEEMEMMTGEREREGARVYVCARARARVLIAVKIQLLLIVLH